MSRGRWEPSDFGIKDMTREDVGEKVVELFNETFRGMWTVDEMLLHPSQSLRFVQDVKLKMGWLTTPEDIILRSLLTRRKNP